MIEAVVIDIDDTLCLTEAVCFDMENAVLAKMGREPMPREVHISTWGQPLFEAIGERSPGVDVDEFKVFYGPTIKEYTESGRLDAIPQANYKALDRLIRMGKTLFALTSRTHGELEHMLEPDHLLATRLKAFYYRDNMQFHKPDPRAFNELLSEQDIEPHNAVYVGDSISDAEAAKKAGLHFVASLESGLRTREDFAHHAVDLFIPRFPDIVEAVHKLDKLVA